MARYVRIHLVHGDEVIGNSCFDPSLMQDKMVLPVFAKGTTVKLGDFALKVTVVKPPTDPLVLAELSGFLSRLGHRNP